MEKENPKKRKAQTTLNFASKKKPTESATEVAQIIISRK